MMREFNETMPSWNGRTGTACRVGASRLDSLRTIAAALTHHRGEMIRIVNEAGDDVGQTNLDGMLIKGHQRIDVELKHRRKLFFSTGGALVRIHCITIDHVAHKITLAVDGFGRENSPQLQLEPSAQRAIVRVHRLNQCPVYTGALEGGVT
jgi:hypothetical protein